MALKTDHIAVGVPFKGKAVLPWIQGLQCEAKAFTLQTNNFGFAEIKHLLSDRPILCPRRSPRMESDCMDLLHLAEGSEAFGFLRDPEEEIYGPDDGRAL